MRRRSSGRRCGGMATFLDETSAGRSSIRVVVAGDPDTGKTSLIMTASRQNFREPPRDFVTKTLLPLDYYPDRVPITTLSSTPAPYCFPSNLFYRVSLGLLDSTIFRSSLHHQLLLQELLEADAIILTYACHRLDTFLRIGDHWLPLLRRRFQIKVPVIVVGCMMDLMDNRHMTSPIIDDHWEVRTVFYYAQKAVLHPTGPLFDWKRQILKSTYRGALMMIFIMCDRDKDGALSDTELNEFQIRCFDAPLQSTQLAGIKAFVQEKMPEGVDERGLTPIGFLFLHAHYIETRHLEISWTILRKFGYDNDLKLRDDLLPCLSE